jgi:hypothetical protein
MTLSASNPRAKSRWTFLSIIVGLGLILGMMIPMIALAAPPKISLEQCRNGSATAPNDCIVLGGGTGWVNGNAGASTAHFVEGHSIPYRSILSATPSGANTVTLGYDIKHSGANAIDFLTQYERLEPHGAFIPPHPAEDVVPEDGFGPFSSTATCAIPKPSNITAANSGGTFDSIVSAGKAVMTVFGASSCSVAQTEIGILSAAQSEARVAVTFTAVDSTVVMAWGGHIARSADWDGNGAAQISGSPYHMRLKEWTAGNVGNQDRSLSAAAVLAEQSTVITTIHAADHTTIADGSTIALGSTVHDSATVTGFEPTGNVTFTFYRGGDCDTGTADAAVAADTVALAFVNSTTSVAHPSPSKGPLAAGSYAFEATYAGDGGNIGSTSACEPFTVGMGDLTVETTIHLGDDHSTNYDRNATGNGTASVAINSVVHDVALVSGAVSGIAPTGAITFTMWSNGACTGDGSALGTGGADGSGIRSDATSALSPGAYSFKATIAADSNYNTATSPCESLLVNQASSTLTSAPWVYPNDSATVSGLVSPLAGSTLTFTAHTANTCSVASQIYSEQFTDIVNQAYDTDNTDTKVSSDSTVYWKVVYSGDANNAGATSNCVEKIELTFTPDPIPAP